MLTKNCAEADLKHHFKSFFKHFCKENSSRFVSGIPSPFTNIRMGTSEAIEEDIQFFRKQNMPYCWYVDEESDSEFKQKLLKARFHDLGVFQGMICELDHSFKIELQKDCTIELVQDRLTMCEFSALVFPIFGITGKAADLFEQALWNESKVCNWILKKDGNVISALSTFLEGSIASVWNAATDPEFRGQGYCCELWKAALNQAFLNGYQTSMTYLTSERTLFDSCKRLGYEPHWQFHAYLCPSEEQHFL